jgi:hypothetical protein
MTTIPGGYNFSEAEFEGGISQKLNDVPVYLGGAEGGIKL